MAPRPASMRQPARPIKSAPRTGTRRSARLQQIQPPPNPEAALEGVHPSEQLQPLPNPEAALEGVHPSEQLQELPNPEAAPEGVHPSEQLQELPPFWRRLSKKNLQILDRLNREDIGPAASGTPTRKTTLSRSEVETSETMTRQTIRSANAIRRDNLSVGQIHIHAEPPDHIQNAIDCIIKAEVSEERRSELRVIAQEFREGCLQNIIGFAGEDDFIDPLNDAIKALGLKNLRTYKKADWRSELKPVAPKLKLASRVQQPGVDGVSALQSLEPLIKTPRPNITIGIEHTALISALSLQGLDKFQARGFLQLLQKEMIQHEPDSLGKPMLISVPASRAWNLAFPFAVVEGKAYSTGKQIFEAENQASVSGACGLQIQLDLDNLVKSSVTGSDASPTTSNIGPPLFFTICTEGPIHVLWAHWTVVEDGVRRFESKVLYVCYALVQESAEGFLVKLNNIGLWGVGPFMESVVERLGIVAKKEMVEQE